MNRLAERVALVTGASRGIGRAVATAFLEEGAKVALLARSVPELESLADAWNGKGRRALAIECDVTSSDSVDRAVSELESSWGRLHIVVNNAGVSGRTPLEPSSDETWRRILDVNLTGSYYVSRRAVSLMTSGNGRIVNMSSILGRIGAPGYAAYCTSKHGILGFTRALALELAPRNITVNAICPGWIDTEMARRGVRETADALGTTEEAFQEQAVADVPQRRFLQPEEVAKLAVFLASDDAAGITGQAYNVSGGQVMS